MKVNIVYRYVNMEINYVLLILRVKYFRSRWRFCKQKVEGDRGTEKEWISRTSYRIGDDFSITAMRLSHRDYTDDARDAIFNRKRVRENNSRGSVCCSVCLRKLPRGLNGNAYRCCVARLIGVLSVPSDVCSNVMNPAATFFLARRFDIITQRRQILTTVRAEMSGLDRVSARSIL